MPPPGVLPAPKSPLYGPGHLGPGPSRGLAEVVGATPAPHIVFHRVGPSSHRTHRTSPASHQHATNRATRGASTRWWTLSRLGAVSSAPWRSPPWLDRGAAPEFDHPRALMHCLGLSPSAYASGERRRPGSITTAGHTTPVGLLWKAPGRTETRPTSVGTATCDGNTNPQPFQDLSWKAQGRLCQRSRRLMARGTHANHVVVALARELGGCLSGIAQQIPVTPSVSLTEGACPQLSRLTTCLGSGIAPVWWSPRRREEAGAPPRASTRGRRPTDARQVGSQPTHSRRINRRIFLAPALPMDHMSARTSRCSTRHQNFYASS